MTTVSLGEWIRGSRRDDVRPMEDLLPSPLPAHVGLWLDRCLWEPKAQPEEKEGKPGRRALYEAAIKSLQGSGAALRAYRPLYQRWSRSVEEKSPEVERQSVVLTATSRIVLHPSTGSTVTEGAVLLHHSYGVPYLPGAALKGLCRARARALEGILDEAAEQDEEHRKPGEWIRWLFGWQPTQDSGDDPPPQGEAGALDFWDALLVPAEDGAAQEGALALDIVNPHHSDYYVKAGAAPASDTDEPKPTHHLTVRPGARFLVVLEMRRPLPDEQSPPRPPEPSAAQWLKWVQEHLLGPALAELGIGARTAAGYGRLAPPTATARPAGAAGTQPEAEFEDLMDVTWEPGSQTLRAGKAVVRQAEAQKLLAALPDELRLYLAKKKMARLKVRWITVGNAAKIVRLGPP